MITYYDYNHHRHNCRHVITISYNIIHLYMYIPYVPLSHNLIILQNLLIHPFLLYNSQELYEQYVANLVIVCVDVILQRKSDRKLLLFLRRDPPARSIWWWPGGRMFRGETFQQAAVRKICEETG